MKNFQCQHCNLLLFFENSACGRCGHALGYLPVENQLSALEPAGKGQWQTLALPGNVSRFCKNAQYDACNWLIPVNASEEYCIACRHNRTVPELSDPKNLAYWRKIELAKHRLFYTLLRLHLPLLTREDNPERGLIFDFLNEPPGNNKTIMTGHEDGIITLALKEADDTERTARRTKLHEPYRTLLGHFRHEIGHYYWDRLVEEGYLQEECRAVFGDDRADYGEALQRHYKQGTPSGWQQNFITAYATSHPWEDFAETWAHYMHIIDCLETSKAYGIKIAPDITTDKELHAHAFIDPYQATDFEQFIAEWLPLTYAMNSMNRSMGLNDIYPFVLTPAVIKKLSFIHNLVHGQVNHLFRPHGSHSGVGNNDARV